MRDGYKCHQMPYNINILSNFFFPSLSHSHACTHTTHTGLLIFYEVEATSAPIPSQHILLYDLHGCSGPAVHTYVILILPRQYDSTRKKTKFEITI